MATHTPSEKARGSTRGCWWTATGWRYGDCQHDAHVQLIQNRAAVEFPPLSAETLSAQAAAANVPADVPWFIPAPVDLHIHGGGGHDCMAGEVALRGMLQSAVKSGTGALLATSVTAPSVEITEFLAAVKRVMQSPDPDAAVLLGAHLEGPFISPEKLGAQPPHTQALDLQQLDKWLATKVVRVVTFAPEIDPDGKLISLCNHYGVRAQLGHTSCSWQRARQALQQGCGVTHLYNAMSGVSARDGGAAVAALAYADYAEIISDGLHVEQAAFVAAQRAIANLFCVSDATAATAMPDGDYQLGSHRVVKKSDAVRLPDGTLAGSCLTQLRSIAVLREWGQGWHVIGELCSARPARWIKAETVGAVERGCYANWLEISDNQIQAHWQLGNRRALDALAST